MNVRLFHAYEVNDSITQRVDCIIQRHVDKTCVCGTPCNSSRWSEASARCEGWGVKRLERGIGKLVTFGRLLRLIDNVVRRRLTHVKLSCRRTHNRQHHYVAAFSLLPMVSAAPGAGLEKLGFYIIFLGFSFLGFYRCIKDFRV